MNWGYMKDLMFKDYQEKGDTMILLLCGKKIRICDITDEELEYFIKNDEFPESLFCDILLDIKIQRRGVKLLKLKGIINDNK